MTPARVMPQWLERLLRPGVPLYGARKLARIAFEQHESGIHALKGHVSEYVEDRPAVLVQLGIADAVDLPQLVQRRWRGGRDEPQGRIVEDHEPPVPEPPAPEPPAPEPPAPEPPAAPRLLRGGAGAFGGSRRNVTCRSPRMTSQLRSVSASVP